MLSAYLWVKSLHLLSVIAWMIAMMYLPRLFVYHHQAKAGGEASGLFVMMERRLAKGIMTPAMIATWLFGIALIALEPGIINGGWFWVKIVAVFAMTGIHGFYTASMKKFAAGETPRTQKFWRMMNEAPFILLILIVIMVIVKPF